MYIRNSLLRRHVLESNRIERIHFRAGYLVQSHMAAALMVARHPRWEAPLDPRLIHRALCRNTPMEAFGGEYRVCPIWVGDTRMPRWEEVPRLMAWWQERMAELDSMQLHERGKAALLLHHWLLCIHPFEDGNGRTARLVLNSLRLKYGLLWMTILSARKDRYYASIRRAEDGFKKMFSDAYA
ncbi:MAG TPA: Fic family protein [Candidatus Paceibacterota bacterium]|nr:Fic family protein [Candidatus Paceibacterota bacterium]